MADLGFVHRFIAARNSERVVLLLLHGTGGTEEDLIPLGQALMPEAAILSVRGKVSENGQPRFFRRFAEGLFDLEDLKFQTDELAEFLDTATQQYGLATYNFAAIGYSNGANIASSLIFSHPRYLTGAVLLRGMIPFKPATLPDLSKVSVLLSSGERDSIVPKSNAEGLADMFRLAEADLQVHWHKGGHELGQDDIDAAKLWAKRMAAASDRQSATSRPL